MKLPALSMDASWWSGTTRALVASPSTLHVPGDSIFLPVSPLCLAIVAVCVAHPPPDLSPSPPPPDLYSYPLSHLRRADPRTLGEVFSKLDGFLGAQRSSALPITPEVLPVAY
jgi:hypothetical protein